MKTFVLDTNVLIHRPDAILSFKENEVVIPIWVLEELDKLKSYSDERGRNARHAIRFLDERRKKGNLSEGVTIEHGIILRVLLGHFGRIEGLIADKPDNQIILAAHHLQQEGRDVFFVSKDINARVKATAIGVRSVDYEKQKVDIATLYSGYSEQDVKDELIDKLEEDAEVAAQGGYYPNQCVLLRGSKSGREVLSIYRADRAVLELLPPFPSSIWGVKPRNREQEAALNLLMDDSIGLVSLIGKAGTGKTLMAVAAGLKKVLEEKRYKRLLITRPVVPMGKDIGFLPGDKEEKLSHWMQPIFDNLDYLINVYTRGHIKSVDELIDSDLLEMEAVSFIRGRSLPHQYIIIDEAQNLSPHEIKTIVSRAGDDTKMVLTGDPYQIDSPYLDSNSNGLTYLVDAFKGQDLFGHMLLRTSERSRLAELAAELL
ncbi:PhoH family protein [Spirochaetia bacterium 38H-sp]|uniref:PhoH family protein n=1 Tax=Rarispira pelagica TaxID=3141764 RepID=A0ABU9UAA8_9SPIR